MNKVHTVVKVGIADLKMVKSPDTIRTSGLGSCVGVIIYDVNRKVAGLTHIMLPDSSLSRQANMTPYKFADTAIDILIEQLLKQGASKYALKAKIAGGAQMFPNQTTSDVMKIGPRNVEAVKEKLHENHIPLVAADIGGNSGRTIEFDPENATLYIRTVNKGETVI